MAKHVIGQVLGGDKTVLDDVRTVGDVRSKMNLSRDYQASVNGDSASDTSYVDDNDFVTFSRKVKGGVEA